MVDNYFSHLYNIAVVYQCIGDIPVLEGESKREAYYLSACFFEIVSANTFDTKNEECAFLSSYYAEMVNHKLLVLGRIENFKETKVYIIDSYDYYAKSTSYENYRKQRPLQNQYLGQICSYAQDYIRKYGAQSDLLSSKEYKEKQLTFERNSK